jgi:hypothetical protein
LSLQYMSIVPWIKNRMVAAVERGQRGIPTALDSLASRLEYIGIPTERFMPKKMTPTLIAECVTKILIDRLAKQGVCLR